MATYTGVQFFRGHSVHTESWGYPPVKITDRQTDGFTIASTALCIATYADTL